MDLVEQINWRKTELKFIKKKKQTTTAKNKNKTKTNTK